MQQRLRLCSCEFGTECGGTMKLNDKFTRLNRTYIVPTRFGFYFALCCLVLFVTAFTYSNNFLYFFVFWMGSIAVTGLLYTNKIVFEFEIKSSNVDSHFADDVGFADFSVANNSMWLSSEATLSDAENLVEPCKVGSVRRKSQIKVRASLRKLTRGHYRIPIIRVESQFPFGLCRAWKKVPLDLDFSVWPERKGITLENFIAVQFPDQKSRQLLEAVSDEQNDTMDTHRPYEVGRSLKNADWKLYSRTDQLFLRNPSGTGQPRVEIRDVYFMSLEFESRMAQLAKLIFEAEQSGFCYLLEVERKVFPLGSGLQQMKMILDYLAQLPKIQPEGSGHA